MMESSQIRYTKIVLFNKHNCESNMINETTLPNLTYFKSKVELLLKTKRLK